MFRLGKCEDALLECQKLMANYPNESQIFTLKGKILHQLERSEEAHKAFIEARNLDKKDSQKISDIYDMLQEELS